MSNKQRTTGDIRADIRTHEHAIRALESELATAEAAITAPRGDVATPDQLVAYRRRRRLVDDLSVSRDHIVYEDQVLPLVLDGGLPLMVSQVDRVADLILGGVDTGVAVRRVLKGE